MATPIEEIEGVGAVYAEKLKAAGISSVEAMLEAGGTSKGRADLAEKTGIASALIMKWTNHADLMRIKGIGKQYAELLELAGVDTVKELRNRNAANLTASVAKANEEKKVSGNAPSESMVADWIEQAKTLDPRVSY